MAEFTGADWYGQGKGGAVAGGKTSASVEAGLEMLSKGGKAADAAAATILTLCIEDFGDFCIGGEVPLIHYNAQNQEIKVLCGVGRAPVDMAAIEWYIQNGIPKGTNDGNIKSAAVPAVIDLVVTALRLWGTLTFEEVVQPAFRSLRNSNYQWSCDLAVTFERLIEAERKTVGCREAKLQAVSDRFYKGDIADELDRWYKEKGGFLRKEDLARHTTVIEDPISSVYKGYTIYKCNTWTQGAVLLQTLRLLEGFDLKKLCHLSPDYIHVVTEAMKLAFADRDEYYADPMFEDVPLKELLSDKYTDLRRALIRIEKASDSINSGDPIRMRAINPNPHPNLLWPKGTTTCCVADRWGNVISCTPSGWGSNAGVGSTGVAHGTRLISIHNWKNHPNITKPGKRPCITLTPSLVCKEGKPVLAISVAGGDQQDQTTSNLLLNSFEFGMLPKEAITQPRFCTNHFTGFFSQTKPVLSSLTINSEIGLTTKIDLQKRGHIITISSDPIANPVMIHINQESGMFFVAGDPQASRKVGVIA